MSRIKQQSQAVGQTNSMVGPLKWMSPEAIRHQEYSEASDVFSFGICVWEILFRETPYPGYTDLQVAMRIVDPDEGPEFRPELPPDTPAVLAGVMRECWAQEASARPSFRDLVPRLAEFEAEMRRLETTASAPPPDASLGHLLPTMQGHHSSPRQRIHPHPQRSSIRQNSPSQQQQQLNHHHHGRQDSTPSSSPVLDYQELADLGSAFALLAQHEAEVEETLSRQRAGSWDPEIRNHSLQHSRSSGGVDSRNSNSSRRGTRQRSSSAASGLYFSPTSPVAEVHDQNNRNAQQTNGDLFLLQPLALAGKTEASLRQKQQQQQSSPYDSPILEAEEGFFERSFVSGGGGGRNE